MKLALCQLDATTNKQDNLRRAKEMLFRAADNAAAMAILPEMFSITFESQLFYDVAEACPGGETAALLSEAAKETGMFIVGGSIPELCDGKLFNTSMSFLPNGQFAGKYRKAHLFDVDVPGVFRFMESDTITRGDNLPLILKDAPIKTGVSICFDIRFPEFARLAMLEGCDLFALPAAFARTTGPRHWEILMRTRALDNQLFVAAVAPAQSKNSHGHSMLVSPDGKVLIDCGEEECLQVVEVDLSLLQEMRQSIPVSTARRTDLYDLHPLPLS